jgi:AhpD family alkylhydroperoxidase
MSNFAAQPGGDRVVATNRNTLIERVCRQMRREFGLCAEPVLLHERDPELCAAVWCALRETLVAGVAPRLWKEHVAAAVSRLNSCPYCVEAHEMMAAGCRDTRGMSAADRAAIQAWVERASCPPGDTRPPLALEPQTAVELRATLFCFHYINRMVTVYLGASPLPVARPWLKRPLRWLSSRYFASRVRRTPQRGTTLEWAPPAQLPSELKWAAEIPELAHALAGLCERVGQLAAASLGRALVAAFGQLTNADWMKNASGCGSSIALMLETPRLPAALDQLGGDDRLLAEVAFLTAVAPHRARGARERNLARTSGDPRPMLAAASWGARAAALGIAGLSGSQRCDSLPL